MHKPDALQIMRDAFTQDADLGMVYCDYDYIDESGTVLRQFAAKPPPKNFLRDFTGACFLFRKAVYDKVGGFNTDYFLAEDFEFAVRVAIHFKMQNINQNLYQYRIHGGSLSATRAADVSRTLARIALLYKNDTPFGHAVKTNKDLAKVHKQAFYRYLKAGDFRFEHIKHIWHYSKPMFFRTLPKFITTCMRYKFR